MLFQHYFMLLANSIMLLKPDKLEIKIKHQRCSGAVKICNYIKQLQKKKEWS